MPIRSNFVKTLLHSMQGKASSEQDVLWSKITNPIIEDIPEQSEKLVTFLYRMRASELDGKTSIYFLSGAAGYTFNENSQFSMIPGTDIAYISMELPLELRTGYNLAKVRDSDHPEIQEGASEIYPRLIGEGARFEALLGHLYSENRVIVDPLNEKTITYYKDMDKQDEIFGKESILELPSAPRLTDISFSHENSKIARDTLKEEGRLIEDSVNFAETSLKDLTDYQSTSRKYWVYLPPNYQADTKTPYPFMLFLDGSSYLDDMPAHIYLENLIAAGEIPPCIAVFLDYAEGASRTKEYNCNARFTQFLCCEFLEKLRRENQLNITTDPNCSTIIGASAAGLAAFHATLSKPDIFGHCIAQSPAFVIQPLTKLDQMIDDASRQSNHSTFIFEIGRYENNMMQLEYEDGTVQRCSSFEVMKHVCEKMQANMLTTSLHEFVGGHNYICYRISLYDRIKEVCERQCREEYACSSFKHT
jgi:enterochelin esterase-like enzyme